MLNKWQYIFQAMWPAGMDQETAMRYCFVKKTIPDMQDNIDDFDQRIIDMFNSQGTEVSICKK